MLAQVSNACRAAYFNLFRIAKIRTSLTITACKTLVHSLVESRIDYGNAVLYGISDRLLHRLEMVQRSAARVVLRIRRGDRRSMTAVLQQLHWLPVKYRIEYKLLVIVFRALHDRTPGVPRLAHHAVRSAPRPTICRSRPTHRSAPQPRALRPPFILSRWANSMELSTGRLASDRLLGQF